MTAASKQRRGFRYSLAALSARGGSRIWGQAAHRCTSTHCNWQRWSKGRFMLRVIDTFLKCDAEGCDHQERAQISREHIGRPCPKCGANLLTEEDYLMGASLQAASDFFEREMPIPEGADTGVVSVNPHGNTITITPKV